MEKLYAIDEDINFNLNKPVLDIDNDILAKCLYVSPKLFEIKGES